MDVVSAQPAFLLHARPYGETSRIVELFSRDHGCVSAVQRGARGRRQRGGSISQFTPLQVGWRGRGSLKSIVALEACGVAPLLAGPRLASGIYLNEMLMRVLRPMDPHESLFAAYAQALAGLASGAGLQPLLRRFECQLLGEIGYGISFANGADAGGPIRAEARYRFETDAGFHVDANGPWPGYLLLAIARGDFSEPATRAAAKAILRQALQPHIGERPLESRQLLAPLMTGKADAGA